MAPQKPEPSISKERQPGLVAPSNPAAKVRRVVSSTNNNSHSRDLGNSLPPPEGHTGHQPTSETPSGIDWSTISRSTLHAYRHAYRLPTPSAFTCAHNQSVLTAPGIGRYSPTMARRKDRRRVSREQLALVCRKDFNAAGVSEQECLAGFLYAVRNQDKGFRKRFSPARGK